MSQDVKMVSVGGQGVPSEKRVVSELNHHLFETFMAIANDTEDSPVEENPNCLNHMGCWHVGQFITWLEDNYDIKEKAK
jgi:hypothetical protein